VTNAFNYSVALAPAQNSQLAQGPPTVAAPFGSSAFQVQKSSLTAAAQNSITDNASEPAQFGATMLKTPVIAGADAAVSLAGEAKLAKESTRAVEQRIDVANRPQQRRDASLPAIEAPATVAAVTTAPTEGVRKSGELAGLASSSGTTAQQFFRLRSLETQVAQKSSHDALAGAKVESADASGSVLNQFTVEQEGNKMRWRDADGSVYEGTVTAAPTGVRGYQSVSQTDARDKDAVLREKAVGAKSNGVSESVALLFSVSGSNVTTRQLVTVNGRFTPNTNHVAGTAGIVARRFAPQPRRAPQRPNVSAAAQENPVLIEGTVRVGAAEAQRFQATPAPR
jgi:hypothetical protein